MPLYANASRIRCGRCSTYDNELRINPNLVCEMADETGAISSVPGRSDDAEDTNYCADPVDATKKQHSKILWTDEAWTQLLGRSPQQLADLCDICDPAKAQHNLLLLRYLEQRLMYMRVILLVGWTGDHQGGRLAVLSVVS